MKLKFKKKYLIIMSIFLILISAIIPNFIKASSIYDFGNDVTLRGYGTVPYHLRNKANDGYFVSTHLVGYYDERYVLSCVLPKCGTTRSR